MWKVEYLNEDMAEITYEPSEPKFGPEAWRTYKAAVIAELDKRERPLYIMSNFTAVDVIDPAITKEFGSAEHLFHDKLGMIVIMSESNSPFHKFWAKIMELKGMASEYRGKLRADFSRERAMQRLLDAKRAANLKG